jgi:hypothetical protein
MNAVMIADNRLRGRRGWVRRVSPNVRRRF